MAEHLKEYDCVKPSRQEVERLAANVPLMKRIEAVVLNYQLKIRTAQRKKGK